MSKQISPLKSTSGRGFGSSTARSVVEQIPREPELPKRLKKKSSTEYSNLDFDSPTSTDNDVMVINTPNSQSDVDVNIESLAYSPPRDNNFENLAERVTTQEKAKESIKLILLEIIERFESFNGNQEVLRDAVSLMQKRLEEQTTRPDSFIGELETIRKDRDKSIRELKLRDEESLRRIQVLETDLIAMRTQLQRSDFLVSSLLVEVQELRLNDSKRNEIVDTSLSRISPEQKNEDSLIVVEPPTALDLCNETKESSQISIPPQQQEDGKLTISDGLNYLISNGFVIKKHSKFGSPKWRLLRVAKDLSLVMWADSKTMMSGFSLSDAFATATWSSSELYTLAGQTMTICLKEVAVGKQTKRLKKTKLADELCFSLIFSSTSREALDIECSTESNRNSLVESFEELLKQLNYMKDNPV